MGDWLQLTRIDLSYNQLTSESLPSSFFHLPQVQRLNLSHNQLSHLNALDSFQHLLHLDLSHNKLSQMPSLQGCLQLRQLFLQSNQFTRLDTFSLCQFQQQLEELDCSENQLRSFTAQLPWPQLKRLDLRKNKLGDVTLILPQCRDLLLGLNQLRTLSEMECVQVQTLDLSQNQLEQVPEWVLGLQDLHRLDVSNNQLSVLPPALGLLPLHSLCWEGNRVKGVPRSGGTAAILKWLQGKLPSVEKEKDKPDFLESDDTWAQQTTQSWKLSGRQLKDGDVAALVGPAYTIQTLDLSQNQLQSFPELPQSLFSSLQHVNLSQNQIQRLSSSFQWPLLTQLQTLTLSMNRIQTLSGVPFHLLTQLHTLDVCYNLIDELDSVTFPPHLKTLLISNNKLEALPVHVLPQASLQVLDCRNNSLSKLPVELGGLKQLTQLCVDGNTFRVPRPNIVAQGSASVLRYLRNQLGPARIGE